jgi:hypothetical protein
MRTFLGLVLVLGLSIALSASASAATGHHTKPRLKPWAASSQRFPSLTGFGSAYAAPRPEVRYDDTPSYDDPSKRGGGAP